MISFSSGYVYSEINKLWISTDTDFSSEFSDYSNKVLNFLPVILLLQL